MMTTNGYPLPPWVQLGQTPGHVCVRLSGRYRTDEGWRIASLVLWIPPEREKDVRHHLPGWSRVSSERYGSRVRLDKRSR